MTKPRPTDWLKTKASDDGNHTGMRIGYRNLPKGLDKNCYEQIYMKEQEQIDALRARIERIEAKFAEQPILGNQKPIATTNHNSVSDALGNQPEYELPDAVHEAVTVEPNPYAVDWSNAPEWADVHAFDEDGTGWWFGVIYLNEEGEWSFEANQSGFTLPPGLDWKQSKTVRP